MASIGKRKRGASGVLDAPKRAKSSAKSPASNPLQKLHEKVAWETAVEAPNKAKELIKANGTNGNQHAKEEEPPSPESMNVDLETEKSASEPRGDGAVPVKKKAPEMKGKKQKSATWSLSESIAGRMLNLEPVFAENEKYLIVSTRSTIHIYAAATSLLTRSIRIPVSGDRPDTRIVSYCLSPTTPEILWVACSNGKVWSVDWTTGAGVATGVEQSWDVSNRGCVFMTVASMESEGRRRDVVFTSEPRKEGWRITASELTGPRSPIKTVGRTIYTSKHQIQFLKTAAEGSVIVAVAGNHIIIGSLRSTEYNSVDKLKYEFRIFQTTDAISSLDVRTVARKSSKDVKPSIKRIPIVEVVVGDVRGSIFLYNDILANLIQLQDSKLGINLTPRKMHWHRQAVHSIKWSLDGNYIISGGTENTMVIWQLDTNQQQYLPHLPATVQNIVVSPSGSSYALQFADNSAIILSTAELTPATNIAGIQASVFSEGHTQDGVLRVGEEAWKEPLVQRTPVVINPFTPSKLLLAAGGNQQIITDGPLIMGTPFLQTFDLETGRNAFRQALTRTHTTNINITPNAHRISEPRVTLIRISHDGVWMATVDEWTPPVGDFAHLELGEEAMEREQMKHREVFLKFWERNQEDDTWKLVSRIDAPHTSSQNSSNPGRILDLAMDPASLRFATIGEDGIVCIWTTTVRKRDNVPVRGSQGQTLRNWVCLHAISFGKQELTEELGKFIAPTTTGSIAFCEDGSVLAVASGDQEGLVHLVEPNSGEIRQSQSGLFHGEIIKMEFLNQDLIILADQLTTYDLVYNETSLNIKVNERLVALSEAQKQHMAHLAVNTKSQTFAVVLPVPLSEDSKDPKSLKYRQSELFIFRQNVAKPVFHQILSSFVTALLPAVDSDGYLILDTSAEIRTVHKTGTHFSTKLAQSTSALKLDEEPRATGGIPVRLLDAEEEEEDGEQLPTPTPTEDGNEEYDENDTPVVTQQQLSAVFDIGPSFALPPMEEMFLQVSRLFSCKPLPQSVS